MTTRRLRLMTWHHHQDLTRQAHRQEGVARRLIALAETLDTTGRPKAAKPMLRLGLWFRVRGLCLLAQAKALNWPGRNTGSL